MAGHLAPLAASFPGVMRLLSRPVVFGSLIPLMTVLNAAAGLIVPMLVTPAVFAQYSLVVTFFQYGLIFDLGTSQLADRMIPAMLGHNEPEAAYDFGQALLWFRMIFGTASFAVFVLSTVLATWFIRLPFGPGVGAMSAFSGLAYMIALGPACIYRARTQRRNYVFSVTVLSAGLVLARLSGLSIGGISGCFLALGIWYAGFAWLLTVLMPPLPSHRPSFAGILKIARDGAPLFATSFSWIFYQTANRWIASGVMPEHDFVRFAFGANILTLLVGAIAGLNALWYPAVLTQFARHPRAAARTVQRDISLLIVVVTLLAALGIVMTPFGVGLLFRNFIDSVPFVQVFLVAIPASALAAWLMPVSLSTGRSPWLDGIVPYPMAIAVLCGAIPVFLHAVGPEGAAWASTAGALVLSAAQLLLLVRNRVLLVRQAAALASAAALGTAMLVALAGLGA